MDKARLMEMLGDATCLISKGDRTKQKLPGIPVLLWGLMISAVDPGVEQLDQVDCQFVVVGVNREQAEKHRAEFIEFLETYPEPQKLADGPTYKHMATIVGDDMTALRVFGLGQTLGLWNVILPDQLGVDPELVDEAADLGLIVATGYTSHQDGELPKLTAVG
jgi:hypothetical protein